MGSTGAKQRTWRIGELADATGVSVRTLHYYEEIGLLKPTDRTPAGHRVYGADDLTRLQQIVSLRQLGLSLDEIASSLRRGGVTPLATVELHLARVREQLASAVRLVERLERLAVALRTNEDLAPDDFFAAIQETIMIEKYYTPEQLQQLEARKLTVGEDRMQAVAGEWAALHAEVRAAMARGDDPTSEPVLELARRGNALIAEFTGGDAGIARSLDTMYRNEPQAMQRSGLDAEMMAYMAKARAALAKP
jgi:DNA-binding transcriptional MerR regulator